tara:strand:- start:203 stop:1894 length:1692 start_codon:yes stop_codon:yes gene_type:complete
MANTIKHKRGSGSDPSASDLAVGELAIRTDTGVVFTKKDDGTVAEISGGGQTNLGVSTTSTAVTVTSDTGNNATISEASGSAAGVMSVAHHDKLDGIASGATANSTESIQDIVGGMVSGNSESGISVTYQDSDGTLDFSVTSQTDNNFTTTLKNKLDGIEASATADQTASEILTAIKTVDGASSGLDADLLDGQHGSHYLDYNNFSNTPTIPTNNNQLTNGAGYITSTLSNEQVQDIVGAMVSGNSESGISVTYQDSDGTLDFSVSSQTDNNFTTTLKNKLDGIESNATADQSASEILTAIKTVDGSGSGLDADTVDGVEASSFLRSDAADTKTSGDLTFNDSVKAVFGTGSDLQLYHDGSDSYIKDAGTGILAILGSEVRIQNAAGSENCAKFIQDGAVELYHNNSKKLATKSDGVDITGELQCDSLDVDGAANITGNVDINGDIRHNGDTNCLFGFPSNDTFRISTGGTERFRITSTGAIAIEGSSNYGSSGQVLTSNGNDAPTWQDGGGTVADGCVYENSQTISNNYTVSTNKNAMSAGPITVNSGVTITVPSGSTYTIV